MSDLGKGSVKTSVNSGCGIIYVDGSFAFHIQSDFRDAYENLAPKCNEIKIDLDRASYMDSSGLGMLLVMKKFLDSKKLSYEIVGSKGQTHDLLQLTHFNKYFRINGKEPAA